MKTQQHSRRLPPESARKRHGLGEGRGKSVRRILIFGRRDEADAGQTEGRTDGWRDGGASNFFPPHCVIPSHAAAPPAAVPATDGVGLAAVRPVQPDSEIVM